jgi:phosphate:Na+ symporter
LAEEIEKAEEKVDWYYRHIMRFLTLLSQKGLTDEQVEESINIQFILKEFEYIGDAVIATIQLAKKLHRENLNIPVEKWKHLDGLYRQVTDHFINILQVLGHWDAQAAGEVIREHPETIRLQRTLQFNYLAQNPQKETDNDFRNEEIFRYAALDLINLLYLVDEHTVNIAQVIMGIV